MNLCKKCGSQFERQRGLISYCSLKCRNSRVINDDLRKILSQRTKDAWSRGVFSEINYSEINKEISKINKSADTHKKKLIKGLTDGKKYHIQTIRKLLIDESNNTCQQCGSSKWNELDIPLEIHHINGVNNDNRLENLQVLCANCHSQTDNFRAKNIKIKL